MNVLSPETGDFPNPALQSTIQITSLFPQANGIGNLAAAGAFSELLIAEQISWNGADSAQLTNKQASQVAEAADAWHIEMGIPALSCAHPTVIDHTAPEGTRILPISAYADFAHARRAEFIHASVLLLELLQGRKFSFDGEGVKALQAAPAHITRAIGMFWIAAARALDNREIIATSRGYREALAAAYLADTVLGGLARTSDRPIRAKQTAMVLSRAAEHVRANAETLDAETGIKITDEMIRVLEAL